MAGYITTKEAADAWGISMRRINTLCKEGRIVGAYKEGRIWMIPADAIKPSDHRFKESSSGNIKSVMISVDPDDYLAESLYGRQIAGIYVREDGCYMTGGESKFPVPIGVSDYKSASTQYYYVDKTMLIREVINENAKIVLFTRPRRFGKTLNMDMLRTYFEHSEVDTSVYFRDKLIWNAGGKYQAEQGQYPVIYLTLKDLKFNTWKDSHLYLRHLLRDEILRHRELLDSERIVQSDKDYLQSLLYEDVPEGETAMFLLKMSKMLSAHYGKQVMILIDEYDTPIQQGYMKGYYEDVISYMRTFLSAGLKDNPYLFKAFLTGILRVAKESTFSGLNHLKVDSVLDTRYAQYFGFTKKEVADMADYYQITDHLDEMAEWYDGYHFGNLDIYNPWSIINYISNDCKTRAYWISTSSNDIIGEVLKAATPDIMGKLKALMLGETVVSYIDTSVIYPQMKKNPSSIFSFLLVTGYLKAVSNDDYYADNYICELALPNKEIHMAYSKEILEQLDEIIPMSDSMAIMEALFYKDKAKMEEKIRNYLIKTISYHDAASEFFYHGLVLGFCAVFDGKYRVTSDREAGDGRYDIQMMPLREGLPGVLIEVKAGKDASKEDLLHLAQSALEQIERKKYDEELGSRGIKDIIKMGIAFCGKSVCVR